MRKIEHLLLGAVAAVILLSSASARAQGAVTYRFLEVVDFSGKPVADAKVETSGCHYEIPLTTDQKGQLPNGLPVCVGDFQTKNFTISKPGYYPFEDLGLLYLPYFNGFGNKYVDKYKIELLKIPENAAERKILGREQLKRELFLAVKYGRTDEVKRLLKAGLNPNLSTKDLRGIPGPKDLPAITYAAAWVDVETMKAFLAAGADVRSKTAPARDILLYYLEANPEGDGYPFQNRDPIEKQKADPLRRFEEGLDALVKAGADREVADADRRATPLKIAARKGYLGIVKKLVAAGVSAQSKGAAVLDLIVTKEESDRVSFGLAEWLLKAGADPNFAAVDSEDADDDYCLTPLIAAGNAGKLDFVRLLLANKADLDVACRNGKTALVAAINERRPETAKMLLEAGANGNGKRFGSLRKTALMAAAEKDYVELAGMLIARGAAVNERDFMINTALDLAIEKKASREMLELLLKAGTDPNGQTSPYCVVPVQSAAARGNLEALRLLIAHKANVNLICAAWDSAIVLAARNSEVEALKILLENGADARGEQGRLGLKYARENLKNEYFKSKAEEIIKLLEAAGAK
jgi:ankyrin repeat protein